VSLAIGIDARAAAEVPAGRGRFVRELLRALARRDVDHTYVLFARNRWRDETLDHRFRWVLTGVADPWWNGLVGLRAHRDSDVFFSTNSYLTAWFTRPPTALNVFDMIAWDAPESAQRRAARIERATIARALRRSAHVFCNSDSTHADLLRRFPDVERKCSVVPLAAGSAFAHEPDPHETEAVRRRYGLERPFVLFTGTLEPRKNLVRLIEAFVTLPSDVADTHELLLVGPRGWEESEILGRAREHAQSIRLLGFVPEEDLASLYRLCEVFAYPSLYEGFGLPVLEALTAGAAVLTSDVSSLPEVGGDAVLYVDPLSVQSIRDSLERLLRSSGEREALRSAAAAQAARFSWDRTADEIVRQLESIARASASARPSRFRSSARR
jgi:glycosyltransferase involved in cell wall biosynthesis